MWNFQRIICIWICCVSCMFGTTQLSTALVQAVPYEYFDDHDQSFYDLDTEQIQAKYDTRLLSQQMLPSSENLKGFHNSAPFHTTNTLLNDDGSHRNTLEMRKQNDAVFMYGSTAKLKSNDGPADGNERNNDWLEQMEETATKAASSTSAFTESLDELHLPRAASCFTNGQKYTHGQKVPRLDNCEVCLCMDGEIFCWWEKCDKKAAKPLTTYDDYSTPFEESSTTRMQLSPKTTFKSTLKPMKKSKTKTKTNEDYKYDDDDSAEIRAMQQEYEGLKEQLAREEQAQEREQEQEHEEVRIHEQHKNHNKQMVKKKIYQQQGEEKYNNKKIKEENQKQKQEMESHRTQQQQKLKSNEHYEQHHHARNHNGNSRHRDNGSSGASSKILNFPENLPSVLYYDYKTEEHHQHQHQHREQHLKHQKQKQQQHEKELKQRQQQKLLQKQQLQQQQQQQQKQQKLQTIQRHHSNRHHEYGQVFHTYNLPDKSEELAELGYGGGGGVGVGGPSTTFKYFSNGNENIYNGGDLLSDSDILPEPPTKKPKILTTTADTTDLAKTTGTPLSQIYRVLTAATAVTTMLPDKSSNTPTTTIIASTPLKKEILSSWDTNKANNDKTNDKNNSNNNGNSNGNSDSKANRNNESTEDLMDTDDQDDAFHRWLTAPDTNNKNYFTFNESTSMSGVGGFDGTNSDYMNGDERNYENIGFDSETGFSSASVATDTKATINVMSTGATKNIETAAASIYSDDAKANGMHENEQHFSGNNVHNGNGNGKGNGNGNYINMASSNGIINGNGNSNNNNNKNIVSPFSQTYENFNRNNNLFGSSTTTASGGNSNESGGGVAIIGSTISNEDNSVASVVNIDIMLTASSPELQQQQPQPQPNTNIQTTNQLQQQQQQEQHYEHEKQIGKTPNEFMQPPSVLISNKNDGSVIGVGVGAVVMNNTLSLKIYDNSSSNINSNSNNNNKHFTNILGGNQNIETQNWGVNLSNNNSNGNTNTNNNTNNNNNSATSYSSSSSSDSFKFKHLPTVLVSQTNATSSTATALTASAIPPTLSTTSSPERQCNVMGTLYKIGDVLPQDTGNCLQCICIDGSTSDDTPRVTCSPHNCPPLVLPDLFDATGY